METTVPQRIKEYLSAKRISVNSLSKSLNLTQTTLSRQFNGSVTLSIDAVIALLEHFPELSAEWLLRGTEPMERTEPTPDPELKAVCIDQAKEIYRLELRISELEGKNGQTA